MYAQDTWRLRPNVTFDYGIRYSLYPPISEVDNKLTTFDPAFYNAANAPRFTTPIGSQIDLTTGSLTNGIVIAGQNSPFGDKIAPENNHAFGPVFGFAWDPFKDGKTAIRGGYGLSYDVTLVGILEQNIFGNPPYVNNVTIQNTVLDDPASVLPTISAAPRSIRGTPFESALPYVQQWSFDFQRELAKSFIVAVGYYGSKGTHLPGIVDFNLVAPGEAVAAGIIPPSTQVTSTAVTARLNAVRPYKGFVAINSIQNWFNSNYNSMQVSADKRFKDGSLVRLSYTWSHSLTDNQTDRSTAPQSFYDRAADYGPSQQDRRQVLSVNYVYELPFFRNQSGFLGQALGGWQFSGISSFAAGSPFTVTSSGVDPGALGFLGPSASGGRPDNIADPSLIPSERTRLKWFETGAFALVPAGVTRPGNSPRGVIVGPGYQKWDVTLGKSFKFTEDMKLQFRAEAYNVFNHTNFSGLGTAFGTSTFGQVTSTRDARIVQFALKLSY
jgi:hypothetical protein